MEKERTTKDFLVNALRNDDLKSISDKGRQITEDLIEVMTMFLLFLKKEERSEVLEGLFESIRKDVSSRLEHYDKGN